MDLSRFKHRARFETTASVKALTETDTLVSKASLAPLKGLLPAGVDPEASPDLLYISSNGAVAGLCNKNGSAVSNETALAIHRSCVHKYINVDHDREQVVGVILYPGLTRFGTNEPITDEEAAALKEPFNMAFAGVLWTVINPMLARYIRQQGEAADPLSMSWEVAFSDYDIGIGPRDVNKARVVPSTDASFGSYDRLLRDNGGDGRDPRGDEVYRIIKGDAIVLGYSIVGNPAAEVKGILPIEKASTGITVAQTQAVEKALAEINAVFQLSDERQKGFRQELFKLAEADKALAVSFKDLTDAIANADAATLEAGASVVALTAVVEASCKKNEEKNATPSLPSVTPNTAPMKIESIEQLESALGKHEATAAVVDFVKAIKDASVKFSEEIKAKEDLVKNAELAKAANEERANKLQASVESLKKELDEVKASQEAAEANQKFQERMASFDEEFDLDDEDRQILASQIKNLDDATFETFAKSCKKLMAGKSKAAKKANPFDKKEKEDDKEGKKEEKEECASVKEALASVKEENGQAALPNGVVAAEDLKAKMAAAFQGSFKINGQTVAERKAAKTKK